MRECKEIKKETKKDRKKRKVDTFLMAHDFCFGFWEICDLRSFDSDSNVAILWMVYTRCSLKLYNSMRFGLSDWPNYYDWTESELKLGTIN